VNAKLQDSLVKEIAADFKNKFGSDKGMQGAAFESAVESLSGKPSANDPLVNHFTSSLGGVDFSGKTKGKADGSVSERLAFLQETQEKEFVSSFYVTDAEAAEVKAAGGDEGKLTKLMGQIYGKIGFHVPDMHATQEATPKAGGASDKFAEEANNTSKAALDGVRKKTLADFQASLA
jgi:hypothetical protein